MHLPNPSDSQVSNRCGDDWRGLEVNLSGRYVRIPYGIPQNLSTSRASLSILSRDSEVPTSGNQDKRAATKLPDSVSQSRAILHLPTDADKIALNIR